MRGATQIGVQGASCHQPPELLCCCLQHACHQRLRSNPSEMAPDFSVPRTSHGPDVLTGHLHKGLDL